MKSVKATRVRLLATFFVILLTLIPSNALAAKTWSQVAENTQSYLLGAAEAYRDGNPVEAKKLIDEGYFGPFEAEGMEATIKNYISAQRAFELEQEFKQMKMLINAGAPASEIEEMANEIGVTLREDAAALDGAGSTQTNSTTPLFQSLAIILREGFEAILVLSAIVAYLVKSGNGDKVRTVYLGAILALAASVITAVILSMVISSVGAFSQELLEGITMLIAVAVLFWVSFWLISKAQAQKWHEYIEKKVHSSLTKRNTFALVAAAFLAVFREGAETILFYKALLTGNPTSTGSIILGFALGSIALVGVFLIFKYGSLKVPIKPFFIATSALLYYLAFVFAGQGMREIQETGLISSTIIDGLPVIDLLGIYPTWETLTPQLALVLIAIGGFSWQFLNSRNKAAATTTAEYAPGRKGL